MTDRNSTDVTITQVRQHPKYETRHQVWKGYQGRWKRCDCTHPERPHFEDPPPPAGRFPR